MREKTFEVMLSRTETYLLVLYDEEIVRFKKGILGLKFLYSTL